MIIRLKLRCNCLAFEYPFNSVILIPYIPLYEFPCSVFHEGSVLLDGVPRLHILGNAQWSKVFITIAMGDSTASKVLMLLFPLPYLFSLLLLATKLLIIHEVTLSCIAWSRSFVLFEHDESIACCDIFVGFSDKYLKRERERERGHNDFWTKD